MLKGSRQVLIVAVILGLVAVFLLNSYIRSLDKPALATVPHRDVVVAKSTIPEHTRITADMLEVVSLPEVAIHPEALRSMDDAVYGITRDEIISGEQVISSRIATDVKRASLSYRVPEGMRALSVPVGEVSGVAGFVSAGDKLDILVTYIDESIVDATTTYTVFQNVLVLAAGTNTHEKDDEASEVVQTVTLAVTPAQAEVLAWATINGSFHLSLRSPLDENKQTLQGYSKNNFDSFKGR